MSDDDLVLARARTGLVAADDQGRLRLDALADALDAYRGGPLIVGLQAGNVHSGAFDLLAGAIDLANRHGAVGARRRRLRPVGPRRPRSTSVADPAPLYAAMGMHAAYLIQDARQDPVVTVPEFSRRARGFPVWAALRSLGRSGGRRTGRAVLRLRPSVRPTG